MRRAIPLAKPPAATAGARLAEVRARIARACRDAGRDPGAVTIVAVSKTRSAPEIDELIALGVEAFGENRVQEAAGKWPALRAAHPGVALHLVGQLQSNKAGEAVALFDVAHSLDRPNLVEALARAADKAGRAPALFLQVNVGDEPQKGGCPIPETPALLARATDAGLAVRGLMCVPPAGVEAAPYFALLAKMAGDLGLPDLSMGMSDDLEAAVMLGATHVRPGTALFGPRPAA
jgi:hypothetical protein